MAQHTPQQAKVAHRILKLILQPQDESEADELPMV